jgi:hypothetical protein
MDKDKVIKKALQDLERAVSDLRFALETFAIEDHTPVAKQAELDAKTVTSLTWHNVGMAYRERFLKAKRGDVLDYYLSKDRTTWEDLAHVVNGYRDPQRALDDALDGFFEDKWVRAHSYPPSALLKGFERFRCPPVVDQRDEPDPEAINARRLRDRQRQEQQELMRSLNETESQAAPPPESLEAMVARIGKPLRGE